jgi:hypothetical protein
MIRLTALLSAVVLTVMSGCVPPAPPLDPDAGTLAELEPLDLDGIEATAVLRAAREFTVRIRALGCDRLGTGSGFVLDDGLIVTNRHVVGQPREVAISTWDGRSFDATRRRHRAGRGPRRHPRQRTRPASRDPARGARSGR